MKNIANKKYIILMLAANLTILYSCSKGSSEKKIIENRSSYTLQIMLFGGAPNWIFRGNFIIAPNSSQTIFEYKSSKHVSSRYSHKSCADKNIDSISIEIKDNLNLRVTKDLTNDNNIWTFSGGSNDRVYSVQCRATITNADIVPK
jgi:hypothetical protein